MALVTLFTTVVAELIVGQRDAPADLVGTGIGIAKRSERCDIHSGAEYTPAEGAARPGCPYPTESMAFLDLIEKKRDGGELSAGEIEWFIGRYVDEDIADYQMAAFLMATMWRGLTDAETCDLTRSMATSGASFEFGRIEGPKVDKHSTGGVGDTVSLLLAPLAAACGCFVPMVSGRGLGHTGGTLDKLESIPGFRTDLSYRQFADQLEDIGVAMGAQTADLVPADRKLYELRSLTATVPETGLITASILSKKIAEGADALVLDVKTGSGAFMRSLEDARRLAARFEQAVLAELERAFDRLDRLLELRPERRIDVVIYDPAIFDEQFRGLFRFQAAGFYHGVIRVRGATELNVELSRVLHHELVHAALDAAAPSLIFPGWVNEGGAEWFEARALGKRALSSGERAALGRIAAQGALLPMESLNVRSFAGMDGNRASVAYLQSYALIDYLVRTFGERTLPRFYAELIRSRTSIAPSNARTASMHARWSDASWRSSTEMRVRPLAAICLLLALACGAPEWEEWEVRGVVRDVVREDGQVVIEHDDIPDLMSAMTMSFDVPDAALLGRMEKGMVVSFTLRRVDRSFHIVAFEAIDVDADAAAPRAARLLGARDLAPDFDLIDQDGRPLRLGDLRGVVVVLDFVFTQCPGPCPILTSSHVALQRSIPADVRPHTRLVSITLDPARDTPECCVRTPWRAVRILSGWSFLGGPVETVDAVVRAYGVGVVMREDGEIEHAVATFLIDPEGRIAKRYLGLEHEPESLLLDLQSLL